MPTKDLHQVWVLYEDPSTSICARTGRNYIGFAQVYDTGESLDVAWRGGRPHPTGGIEFTFLRQSEKVTHHFQTVTAIKEWLREDHRLVPSPYKPFDIKAPKSIKMGKWRMGVR